MPHRGRMHGQALLDAIELQPVEDFSGRVWRITRKGRNALLGSSAPGRWSPSGNFDVLYTSLERAGALAEIGYRMGLEPVWPSRLEHQIHAIDVRTERNLRFNRLADLASLGVDIQNYGSVDYDSTQAIAAAAHFLEFDGLIVPSARFSCSNLVIFMERPRSVSLEVRSSEDVDWDAWRRHRFSAKTIN